MGSSSGSSSSSSSSTNGSFLARSNSSSGSVFGGKKKQAAAIRKVVTTVLVAVAIVAGCSVLLSPPLSLFWNDDHQHSNNNNDVDDELLMPSRYSATSEARILNIHIVPHTHDDVGWLKTVDQYYFGLNQTIQMASVRNILDSVIDSLLENPSRTFTYVEQKFFSMWWERQQQGRNSGNGTSAAARKKQRRRESVRRLVANGQLNFVNGGWCMHDEATTHYVGMIDQTTVGHAFLKREFGVAPTVGWQLDPFGHSATQASLMTHKVGFDAVYFGRIDYQDLTKRKLERGCEGLWNAASSSSGGSSSGKDVDATVFWGLTGSFGGMYGPPKGFCLDQVLCKDPPQLAKMNRTQLVDKVEDFLRKMRVQSDETQGSHIMVTMGEDFNYQRARSNFANLDALIGAVKHFQQSKIIDVPSIFAPQFDSVNIFYSSPDYYTKCKHEELTQSRRRKQHQEEEEESFRREEATNGVRHKINSTHDGINIDYTVKVDDFFPYSDREHGFWTGYFTSRSSLKRHERVASSFLLAARQIETMLDFTGKPVADPNNNRCQKSFDELEDAVSIVQHHDGVSGTAKQHVANDYSKRLQSGIDKVSVCTATKLKRLFLGKNETRFLKDFSLCQRINETICSVSQKGTRKPNTADIYAVVYNGLGRPQSTVVFLPVSSAGSYQLWKVGNSREISRVVQSIPSQKKIAEDASKYVVPLVTGSLPPLGASIFQLKFIEPSRNTIHTVLPDASVDHRSLEKLMKGGKNRDVVYSNGLINVTFDRVTGVLKKMGTSKVNLNLSQVWGYYTSFDSQLDKSDDNQNSGAYIFRPSIPEQRLQLMKPLSARFYDTSDCMEVHVEYEEGWIQTIFRVMPGLPYLEVEYTVGPIPVGDGRGKEIVTRFSSNVRNSKNVFYTDSNGREFIRRQKNYRPTWDINVFEPVAGNYYPVNTAMYIEDGSGNEALTVATDRSQGGASLEEGSIELMVHRRILADDKRGVGEPMNETDGGVSEYPPFGNATRRGEGLVVRGKHRILVGDRGGATLARSIMDSAFVEPLVFVGSSKEFIPFQVSNFSGVGSSLPPNLMLITRLRLPGDALLPTSLKQFLIRLGHQYGVGEDETLSNIAHADLVSCLPGYSIISVEELTLSGNQNYYSWLQNRLDWSGDKYSLKQKDDHSNRTKETMVELEPMNIRTFKVTAKVAAACIRD